MDKDGEKTTARQVLQFLCELNRVVLQDAAAMLVLHPERVSLPLFRDVQVFSSEEFEVRSAPLLIVCERTIESDANFVLFS